MPAWSTGVRTLPSSAPPHRNWKSARSPTPLPQLTKGPYSQLRALRTSATGLSGSEWTPGPEITCGTAWVASGAVDLNETCAQIGATAKRRTKKNPVARVKRLPFLVWFLQLSQKRPTRRAGPLRIFRTDSAGHLFHLLGIHIEVRVDVLGIVEILKGFQKPHHLRRCRALKLGVGGGQHRHFAHYGRDVRCLDGREHCLIGAGVGDDFPGLAFIAEVLTAVLEHDVHQLFFAGSRLLDCDHALLRKHKAHRAGLTEVAAVLGQHMADLTDRPIAIVCGDVHDESNAAGAVALEADLFIHGAGQFARAALDGAFDVVRRHVFRFGGENRRTKTRIAVGVAA